MSPASLFQLWLDDNFPNWRLEPVVIDYEKLEEITEKLNENEIEHVDLRTIRSMVRGAESELSYIVDTLGNLAKSKRVVEG